MALSEVELEKRRVKLIEKDYLTEKRTSIYTALEDIDFLWSPEQVEVFDILWKTGEGRDVEILIHDIAEHFSRDPDEVAILAMCRKRKGRI